MQEKAEPIRCRLLVSAGTNVKACGLHDLRAAVQTTAFELLDERCDACVHTSSVRE